EAELANLMEELNELNMALEQNVINKDENEQDNDKGASNAANKQVAFVYHTHNRESWLPELSEGARDISSNTKNITLVGKRFADSLNKPKVETLLSDTYYSTEIADYRWEYSYKYSNKTVKEAIASYEDLEMFFDIHRDSQPRKYTT